MLKATYSEQKNDDGNIVWVLDEQGTCGQNLLDLRAKLWLLFESMENDPSSNMWWGTTQRQGLKDAIERLGIAVEQLIVVKGDSLTEGANQNVITAAITVADASVTGHARPSDTIGPLPPIVKQGDAAGPNNNLPNRGDNSPISSRP